MTVTVTDWDARAEWAVGQFIRRYLAENPPPDDSAFADDLEGWAGRLIEHGDDLLAAFHVRTLTAVPPGA